LKRPPIPSRQIIKKFIARGADILGQVFVEMAGAAARAAVSVQMRQKQMALRQKAKESAFDDKTRKRLLGALRNIPEMTFLANVAGGKLPDILAEVETSASELKDGSEPDGDGRVRVQHLGPEFPSRKPCFVSKRHYDFLKLYFSNGRLFQPEWLSSYFGNPEVGNTSLLLKAVDEIAQFKNIEGTYISANDIITQDEIEIPVFRQRMNEAVLICQVFTFSEVKRAGLLKYRILL
jgi:hypothetical protein